MTVFVDDTTLRDARDRAARLPLGPAEQQRWRDIAAYGAARRPDPNAERSAVLRELLSLPAADDRAVLDAGGRLLGAAVTGDAGPTALATQVHALCLRWFDEDVKEAAPLLELFTGHHRAPEGGPPQADPELVSKLARWLARRAGAGARIENVAVISGGFSRLMLDVRWTGGHGVVRIEQDGMFATEGRREAAVMRILRARGYPVPAVSWEETDPGVLGHPFFVMEYVAGRARTDDQGLDDMVRSLAQLHGLGKEAVDEVAALDGLPAGSEPDQAIDAQLRHWHDVYRSAVDYPIPLLERSFAWLRTNLRATAPSVIVHGDPGPGNALQNEDGVAAVIDWELAHAGDAAEDWAYLALIRGRRLASPQSWKARLAATVGVEYDEQTWQAWEAFNSVKGACVNLTALDVFRRTARPTPDLLAIGVAVHLRFLSRAVELTP
ncbi:MAG: phosphotransferase family protein [Trebonia sp.]|jgi:aminoglycoside phosphotransferase (APT) family kinase protein